MPSEEFEGLVAQIAAIETGWLNNPPLWPDRKPRDSKP